MWCAGPLMAAGACLASPCLLPAKGGRAACVRASVRAPRSATHLDRERPADHPLCAGRGSFEILDTDKFMALWSRGSKTSTVTSNNFKASSTNICAPGAKSRPAYVLPRMCTLAETKRPRRGAGRQQGQTRHLNSCQRAGWVRCHEQRGRQQRAQDAHACAPRPAAHRAGCPWQRGLAERPHVQRCAPTAPGCRPPATCSTSAGRQLRQNARAAPKRQLCEAG